MEGTATAIDPGAHTVSVRTATGDLTLTYDQLVLAMGSELSRPPLPGLKEYAFSVDTYQEAQVFAGHLASLRHRTDAARTAVVAGSGLEVATTLVGRLRQAAGEARQAAVRVVLVEKQAQLALDLGDEARQVVAQALQALGVTVRLGVLITGITPAGVTLSTGEFIPAATTVWTAGVRANHLAAGLPVTRDALGRLPVDPTLRVAGRADIFAAGDVARAMADATHVAPMTCQHAMPQGKVAGHNAACALLGQPLRPAQPGEAHGGAPRLTVRSAPLPR